MKEIQEWMQQYIKAVRHAFGKRIVCIGLQGSQARGEATEQSDIDAVLILDSMDADDLVLYRNSVAPLPERDKLCGFVSGKEELLRWEKGDLFSFYYDVLPIYGSIDFLQPLIRREDIRSCVLTGACALYHACAHNLVHERSSALLTDLQKSAFFTLRAKHFYETGTFIKRRADLRPVLACKERALLETAPSEWELLSNRMLSWASETIRQYGTGTKEI